MDKKSQLEKFGIVLKGRRNALSLTMRQVSELSGISPALIAKLENGTMLNFPKTLTIRELSRALQFNDELFVLAGVFIEHIDKSTEKSFEEQLRELLATKTKLNAKNINQAIYFISGLEKLQEIEGNAGLKNMKDVDIKE